MNKKFASLGTALSRDEAKKVMGGDTTVIMFDNGTCTASARCTGGRNATCSGTSSCSATDDVGVTCDGVETKCTKLT